MVGLRLSGIAVVSNLSLPYSLADTDATWNIWRVINNVPTNLTNFVVGDGVLAYSEKWNPVVSPDGTTIVWTTLNGDTLEYELWTCPGTGGTPVSIRLGSTESLNHPYWAPDSSHFIYTEGVSGDNGGDIRRMDPDGTNDTLVLNSGTNFFYRPQYNNDGSLIVFARRVAPSTYTLRVCEDDGTNDTLVASLVNYAADGSQFSFANTSNRIAYWGGFNGVTRGECYTIDPDGTDSIQISTPNSKIWRISKYSWLPDDSLILGIGLLPSPAHPTSDEYRPVSFAPASATVTVINEAHQAGAYLSRRCAYYWEGRFYFLEEAGANPILLVSILPDGTDYRVEQDASAAPVSNAFGPGAGPEYI